MSMHLFLFVCNSYDLFLCLVTNAIVKSGGSDSHMTPLILHSNIVVGNKDSQAMFDVFYRLKDFQSSGDRTSDSIPMRKAMEKLS